MTTEEQVKKIRQYADSVVVKTEYDQNTKSASIMLANEIQMNGNLNVQVDFDDSGVPEFDMSCEFWFRTLFQNAQGNPANN